MTIFSLFKAVYFLTALLEFFDLYFHLSYQLRQFRFALFFGVRVHVSCHAFAVHGWCVTPFPQVIVYLTHTAGAWLSVFALCWLEFLLWCGFLTIRVVLEKAIKYDVEEKEQLIASNFKIESPFLSNVGGRLGDRYQNLDEIMSKECFVPLRDNERYKKLLIDVEAFKERLK